MKIFLQIALIGTLLAVAGCAAPGHYPISGEECSSDDVVLDMEARDCTAPTI